jgi:hypothetical protein
MSVLPLVLLVTMGAGKAAPLPSFDGPLGRFDRIVEHEGGRKTGNDVLEKYEFDSCKEPVVLNLTTVVAGLGRVVQQADEWFRGLPDLEKKVLGDKGHLTASYRSLMESTLVASETCASKQPEEFFRKRKGAKLERPCAPTAEGKRTLGHYWFGRSPSAVALVTVARAPVEQGEGCGLVLTATVFLDSPMTDLKVQVSPGKASAQLKGRDCQLIEFTDKTGTGRVGAVQRSCKN